MLSATLIAKLPNTRLALMTKVLSKMNNTRMTNIKMESDIKSQNKSFEMSKGQNKNKLNFKDKKPYFSIFLNSRMPILNTCV